MDSDPSTDSVGNGATRFDAFISYSHEDDARSAPVLQRAIESALDRFFGGRSLRAFRDEANLPMSEDLWSAIVSSLDRSDFFLLLASPGSRSSEWVEREVAHFLTREGNHDRIGLVLTAGKTPWTDPDFAPKSADSAIGGGVLELLTRDGREPRIVDLRPFRKPDGTFRKGRAFTERVAEIVARIKGVDKDVVLRAHLRERRRRVTILALAVIVALLASALALVEFDRRQEQKALKLTADAYEILYRQPLEALDLAYRAADIRESEQAVAAQRDAHRVALKRMHTTAAEHVYLSGLEGLGWARRRRTTFVSRASPDGRYELRALASPGERTRVRNVYLVDHESGYMRPLAWPKESTGDDPVSAFGFFSGRAELFVLKGYVLYTFDLAGAHVETIDYANLLSTKNPVHLLSDLQRGKLLLAATTSGAVWLLDPDRKERQEIEPRDSIRGPVTRLVTSQRGDCALLVFEDESAAVLRVVESGRVHRHDLAVPDVINGAFWTDAGGCRLVVVGRNGLARELRPTAKEVLEGHDYDHGEEDVGQVLISADGKRLITLSDVGTARIWKGGSDTPLQALDDRFDIDWRAWVGQDLAGETLQPMGSAAAGAGSVLFEDPVPGEEVIEIGGKQLLLADRSLLSPRPAKVYEVQGDRLKPLIPGNPGIHQILEFEGDLWLCAYSSVFRVRGTEVFRLQREEWGPSMGTPTNLRLYSVKGRLWLGTVAGAYRIDGDRAILLTDRSKLIVDIEEIHGAVWILANVKRPPYGPYDTVLLRMHGDRVRELHRIETQATDLVQFEDSAYISSSNGTYRVDTTSSGHPPRLIAGSGSALRLHVFDNQLWSSAASGPAFHIGPAGATPIPSRAAKSRHLLYALGKVWMTTQDGPAYVVEPDGSALRPVPDAQSKVRGLLLSGDSVWTSTDDGAYRTRGADSERVPDLDLVVVDLQEIDGAVWIVTAEEAFRVDGEVIETYLPSSTEHRLTSVFSIADVIAGSTSSLDFEGVSFQAGPMIRMEPQRP